MSLKHLNRNLLPFLSIGFFVILLGFFVILYFQSGRNSTPAEALYSKPKAVPQISGWIAWWAEDKAYNLIDKNPNSFQSVSPVWFMINKDLKLEDIGEADRLSTVEKLKANNIKVLPSLGSELTGDEIGRFLKDYQGNTKAINQIVEELDEMNADGLDVDLEGINKNDKEKFTLFLAKLKRALEEKNLSMTVTIHARTKTTTWEGAMGQDLKWIGENADEVRIMTYDEHSGDSDPGPVASNQWIKDVINYNKKYINKDKITIGIPSYGYIWTKENSRGLQHDEFLDFLKDKKYTTTRDNKSGEIIYKSKDLSGWLSDSVAMKSKIAYVESLGINRFVIWHLGGLDEKFFDNF